GEAGQGGVEGRGGRGVGGRRQDLGGGSLQCSSAIAVLGSRTLGGAHWKSIARAASSSRTGSSSPSTWEGRRPRPIRSSPRPPSASPSAGATPPTTALPPPPAADRACPP